MCRSLEEETGFVWDGSHLLQEVHPDGRYTYIYTDPDSYEPLAQARDLTTAVGESQQQTHYFHCDKIGISKEMTDIHGNLLWCGEYTGWAICCLLLVSFDLLIYLVRQLEPVPCIILERTLYLIGRGFFFMLSVMLCI